MKSVEQFLSALVQHPDSLELGCDGQNTCRRSPLSEAVRQAASRNWHIYPVSRLAKLIGNPDLLIGEATSDLARIEQLALQHPFCDWRLAIGPSRLCVLVSKGPTGRDSSAALSSGTGDCLTLQARSGEIGFAFFRWPDGLILRDSAKMLAAGLNLLGPGDTCAIPPCGGCAYINPWADIESVPLWLRELAFESPDGPRVRIPVHVGT